MKTKHTPAPWHVDETGVEYNTISPYIMNSENVQLAATCTPKGYEGVICHKANAAFIVKAVNNHELLLNYCKEALSYLERAARLGFAFPTRRPQEMLDLIYKMEALIQAIEGERE